MTIAEKRRADRIAKRNREIVALYSAGYSFANVALAYDLAIDTVRNIYHKKCDVHIRRDDYKQRDCTPEEVYHETEFLRNRTFFYEWPPHRRTPRPWIPPPPKPLWVLTLVTSVGEFIGVTAIRADDMVKAGVIAQYMSFPPGTWVGGIMPDADNVVPGDLIGRFTSKEELISRELIHESEQL